MKSKFYLTSLITIGLILSIRSNSNAQSYIPDSTWNGTGIKTFTYYNRIDRGFGSVLQADQKLIIVGLSNPSSGAPFELIFTRFKIDGTLDSTFSGDGKAYVSMGNQSSIGGQTPQVKITSDGKIVGVNMGRSASGTSEDIMVCRLDSNGVLDNTFNGSGRLFVDMTGTGTYPDIANDFDIDSNGNIYTIGSTRNGGTPLDNDFAVIKVTPAGTLDPTFDTDGKKLFNPSGGMDLGSAIKIQSDGKIIIGGTGGLGSYLMRFDSTGTLDPTFNSTGSIAVNFSGSFSLTDLDIDSLGRIICTGAVANATDDIGVVRYNFNGTLDTTFGTAGKSVFAIGGYDEAPTAILSIQNGKILIGGSSDNSSTGFNYMICRVDSTGILDLSFNSTGYKVLTIATGNVDDMASSMVVMNDGRIMLTGTSVFSSAVNEDVSILRLVPYVSTVGIETLEAETNSILYPNPASDYIILQTTKISSYLITDVSGRITSSMELPSGTNRIDISTFENGLYFLKNTGSGELKTFIKL